MTNSNLVGCKPCGNAPMRRLRAACCALQLKGPRQRRCPVPWSGRRNSKCLVYLRAELMEHTKERPEYATEWRLNQPVCGVRHNQGHRQEDGHGNDKLRRLSARQRVNVPYEMITN